VRDVFQRIADPRRCFLIAEIGSNHNGDFDTALRLMDVARRSGADAVKFQSLLADHLVTPDSPDYALLKRIELPRAWYSRLKAAADERGLVFFSTATNSITLGWLAEVGAELYKLASPNLTHLPLIREVAALGRPVIVSTGMAGMAEIDEAVRTFTAAGNRELALLHCTSEYPAKPENLNLRAIPTLASAFPYPIGFSDHSLDGGTAVAAVALGAKVIEKHLTLDRKQPGPDHHYALEPNDFVRMGESIRVVERALGDGRKMPTSSEREKAAAYWRSLHTARDLPEGHVLSDQDIVVVRPNDGLHPRYLDDVTGLVLRQPLRRGQPLLWSSFKRS
jgi:N,N'-diacetyllegionaminate synthase